MLGLAVEHGPLDRQRRDRVTGARESLRIVARRPSPQADLLAVFAGNDPVAVPLDLMEPAGPGRWPVSESGLAGEDEASRLGTGSDRPGNAPEHTQREGCG